MGRSAVQSVSLRSLSLLWRFGLLLLFLLGGTITVVAAYYGYVTRFDNEVESTLRALAERCVVLHRHIDDLTPLTTQDRAEIERLVHFADQTLNGVKYGRPIDGRSSVRAPDEAQADLHEAEAAWKPARSRLLAFVAADAASEPEARRRAHASFPGFQSAVNRAHRRLTVRRATTRTHMTHTLVLISVVNACFVLLGIWGAKRLIVQPVLLVAAGARKIADGAYGHHVQAVTNDEIGALAESFNHMSDRLDETVKALQASELAHTQKARELAEKASELAVINADLEQYTYAASHDLQEPLRMVSTYSQMLSLKYKNILGSDGELYLSFIGAGASRMQHLIKDLLSYNRVLHTPASREPADANKSLQAALTDCTIGVGEAKATVQCGALPSVLANPTDLELVFQNLLSNSIKYRSTSPPEIRITGATEDGVATFRISDNGMGIDPEYHERIFGLFKRLHGRDVPGTGMGLALTKRIIEKYGGQIRVESRLGEGATFVFTLPAWDRQHASAVAAAQA